MYKNSGKIRFIIVFAWVVVVLATLLVLTFAVADAKAAKATVWHKEQEKTISVACPSLKAHMKHYPEDVIVDDSECNDKPVVIVTEEPLPPPLKTEEPSPVATEESREKKKKNVVALQPQLSTQVQTLPTVRWICTLVENTSEPVIDNMR